jgi:hypothetical protein
MSRINDNCPRIEDATGVPSGSPIGIKIAS